MWHFGDFGGGVGLKMLSCWLLQQSCRARLSCSWFQLCQQRSADLAMSAGFRLRVQAVNRLSSCKQAAHTSHCKQKPA